MINCSFISLVLIRNHIRIRSFGLTQTVYVLLAWPKRTKRSSDCPFFCLDAKEPKNQGSHSGGYGLGRCAKISENSLRSDSRDFLTLRSVDRLTPPPLGQINGQLRMDNGQFFPSSIYQWNRLRDCRGAALLRLITSFHNQMAINKITNEFIMLFVVLSYCLGWRRSTLRLYNLVQFSILHFQLMKSVPN